MKLSSNDIQHNAPIAETFCFGRVDPQQHVALADNISPQLAWSGIPGDTRSLALICVDPDVPSKPDDVNQQDREVPPDLPRINFYHWLMVDIPPSVSGLERGECGEGITPRGKRQPPGPTGSRQGINDFSNWFAGDEDMEGQYFGYDGPCPPWNDSLIHHYHFRLFALDCPRLDLPEAFTGDDVLAAMKGHVLDEAEIVGTCTLNPRLRHA